MQCPECKSENTQRMRVIYEGGTQSIQTTSTSGGVGIGSGFMSGGGVTTTSGVAQSGLAAKASPPAKSRYWPPIALAILGIFLNDWSPFVGIPVFGFGVYRIWQTIQFNRTAWPALVAAWDKTWMCHRCGHTYAL